MLLPAPFRIKLSLWLVAYWLVLLMAAWLAVALAAIPIAFKLLLLLSCTAPVAVIFYRQLHPKFAGGCISLRMLESERWLLNCLDGTQHEAQLIQFVSTPWVILLYFKLSGSRRRQKFLLFPDSLQDDDHRRLRVLLNWDIKAA